MGWTVDLVSWHEQSRTYTVLFRNRLVRMTVKFSRLLCWCFGKQDRLNVWENTCEMTVARQSVWALLVRGATVPYHQSLGSTSCSGSKPHTHADAHTLPILMLSLRWAIILHYAFHHETHQGNVSALPQTPALCGTDATTPLRSNTISHLDTTRAIAHFLARESCHTLAYVIQRRYRPGFAFCRAASFAPICSPEVLIRVNLSRHCWIVCLFISIQKASRSGEFYSLCFVTPQRATVENRSRSWTVRWSERTLATGTRWFISATQASDSSVPLYESASRTTAGQDNCHPVCVSVQRPSGVHWHMRYFDPWSDAKNVPTLIL